MVKQDAIRCHWASGGNDLMEVYHDKEWGVPLYHDEGLFEYIILDSFQAGLSWQTIINKRENFRKAFHYFNPSKIAQYSEKDYERLLADAGIVRNKLKIKGAIKNAQEYLRIQEEFGSFKDFIWQFVGGVPKMNHWKYPSKIPVSTRESDAISKALQARGFTFVGTTICYAFMQAAGMVNDHTVDCYRHAEVKALCR